MTLLVFAACRSWSGRLVAIEPSPEDSAIMQSLMNADRVEFVG
jgi:hypothetical protein